MFEWRRRDRFSNPERRLKREALAVTLKEANYKGDESRPQDWQDCGFRATMCHGFRSFTICVVHWLSRSLVVVHLVFAFGFGRKAITPFGDIMITPPRAGPPNKMIFDSYIP